MHFFWKKWQKECWNAILGTEYLIFSFLDHLNKGIIKVKYCPIDEMFGDFMNKPFQGKKYLKFREAIMGDLFRMEGQ